MTRRTLKVKVYMMKLEVFMAEDGVRIGLGQVIRIVEVLMSTITEDDLKGEVAVSEPIRLVSASGMRPTRTWMNKVA